MYILVRSMAAFVMLLFCFLMLWKAFTQNEGW